MPLDIQASERSLLLALLAVERGMISPTDMGRAVRQALSRGEPLPAVLMAEKLLDQAALEQLVRQADNELGDAMATLAATLGKTEADQPSTFDETIGTVTPEQPGRYTVQGVHGRGGQARVLLAFDAHIGREVALKELLADHPSGEASSPWASPHSIPGVVRFLREARVTGQLEHPNIVPVYEVGRRADGTLYYTMRLVRGQTLAEKLKACHNLAERMKLLGVFWDMCKAIAYAHSRGVVHRDLKPSNVMVGEFGETVLLDWGIAKVRGKRDIGARELKHELKLMAEDEVEKTSAGATMGTPSYMSPEQARGEIDLIDERSDVWGLGAVLYELLTGVPPHQGKTRQEILLKAGRKAPKAVRELCPEAPAELAAITQKALQLDPTARYQSARELSEDVGAYMTGEKVAAYRYSTWELVKRYATQHKATVFAVVAVLVVLLGALVAVSLALRSESEARRRESLARENEEAARAKEHLERLQASFYLAQAHAEKADRLMTSSRFLEARIYAAAALLYNPVHPKGPYFDPAFERQLPQAQHLRVEAASQIFRLSFRHSAELVSAAKQPEVLTHVAFSASGKYLAVGCYDGSALVFDDRGQRLLRLSGRSSRVYDVAFSPGEDLLAAAFHDGSLVLWQLPSGKVAAEFTGHHAEVRAVRFLAGGSRLASVSDDGALYLWDLERRRPLESRQVRQGKLTALAVSADGRLLASAGEKGGVALWSGDGFRRRQELSGPREPVYTLAFSPDGRWLVAGGDDRELLLWDLKRKGTLRRLRGHRDGVLSAEFLADGSGLLSTGYDRTVRLWNLESGECVLSIAHPAFVYGVAAHPRAPVFASAGYDRTLRLWQIKSSRLLPTLEGHQGTIYALALSPDGKLLASAGWDHTVRLWDTDRLSQRRVLRGHQNVIDCVSFSPDGRRLASSSRDGTVRVWEVASGKELALLKGHKGIVYGVAYSPDGRRLATSGMDQHIRIWDAENYQLLKDFEAHQGEIDNLAWSPDNRWLASVGHDVRLRLFEAASLEQIRVMAGHGDWISGLAFSHRGDKLASCGKDALAIVWNPENGQQLGELRGHEQWVNSVRFSPDDRLLATAADDRTVRLWSAEDYRPLLKIPAASEVVAVAFDGQGRWLAIGDGERIRLYPLDFSALNADPVQLLRQAEAAAGLSLQGFNLIPAGEEKTTVTD